MNTFCFLHGFGSNAFSFLALQQALIDSWDNSSSYRSIGLDFAGFGRRSEIDVSEKPIDAAIKDVILTLENHDNITLVAHSMASLVALPAASWLREKYPEKLKGVALIEGNLVKEDCGDIAKSFRDARGTSQLIFAKQALVRDCTASDVPSIQRWGKAVQGVKLETLRAYAGSLIAESERGNLALNYNGLADKGVEMRYIHGDGKDGHPVLNEIYNETIVPIPNAGHFVHEDQPEAVARAIMAMS